MSTKVAKKRSQKEDDEILRKEMKRHLQDNLQMLMARNGEKQEDAADAIGITRQNLSKYVSGKALPSSLVLRKIARRYKVTCDFLIGNERGENPDENYIIEKTGLSKKAVDKLSKRTEEKRLRFAYGLSRLIESDCDEFLEAFCKYVATPQIRKDDLDKYFYKLYLRDFYVTAEPTYYASDNKQTDYELLSKDEIFYHQLVRGFNKLVNEIKNDPLTKKKFIEDFEKSHYEEYQEIRSSFQKAEDVIMGGIYF